MHGLPDFHSRSTSMSSWQQTNMDSLSGSTRVPSSTSSDGGPASNDTHAPSPRRMSTSGRGEVVPAALLDSVTAPRVGLSDWRSARVQTAQADNTFPGSQASSPRRNRPAGPPESSQTRSPQASGQACVLVANGAKPDPNAENLSSQVSVARVIPYGPERGARPAVCRTPEGSANNIPDEAREKQMLAAAAAAACRENEFDASRTYVIIQICKLDRGLPLLPSVEPSGATVWCAPTNPNIHLADYLTSFLSFVTKDHWDGRVYRSIDGFELTRYQAAVNGTDWELVWDALLKPFVEQRRNYRRLYRCKNAPDLLFGVAPRLTRHVRVVQSGESDENAAGVTTGQSGLQVRQPAR